LFLFARETLARREIEEGSVIKRAEWSIYRRKERERWKHKHRGEGPGGKTTIFNAAAQEKSNWQNSNITCWGCMGRSRRKKVVWKERFPNQERGWPLGKTLFRTRPRKKGAPTPGGMATGGKNHKGRLGKRKG